MFFSSYQLIDCFPILNANRRSRVPQADGRVVYEDDVGDEDSRDFSKAFFPFEPYLLIQSGIYINGNDFYLEYDGKSETIWNWFECFFSLFYDVTKNVF